MKSTFLFLCINVSLLSYSVNAQLQIMPSVNVLRATGSSFVGASLSGRYFVSPHLTAGINLRYVPEIDLLMTTLEVDYFLLTNKLVRPYIGLEAGLLSDLYQAGRRKTPGIGPKIGLQCSLSSRLGFQIDAGYPIAILKGESFGSDSGLLIGAGLNFTLGER